MKKFWFFHFEVLAQNPPLTYSTEWQRKFVATDGIELDDYLQQLFRGGTSSIALRDFIFQTFSIIDFISPKVRG